MTETELDEIDRERWPEAKLDHLGNLDQWRALDALYRMKLVHFATAPTEATLRLWHRGRKTDAQMAKRRPLHARVPPWVNAFLSAAAPDYPAALADREVVEAAEAVALMVGYKRGIAGTVFDEWSCARAIRKMLDGQEAT